MVRRFKDYLVESSSIPKFDKAKVTYDGKSYVASNPLYDNDVRMWTYQLDGDKEIVHDVYEDELDNIKRKTKKVVQKPKDYLKLIKKYDKLNEIGELILELGDENSGIVVERGWVIMDGERIIHVFKNENIGNDKELNEYIDQYLTRKSSFRGVMQILESQIIQLHQVGNNGDDYNDYDDYDNDYDRHENILSDENLDIRKSTIDNRILDRRKEFQRDINYLKLSKSFYILLQRIIKAYSDVSVIDHQSEHGWNEFIIIPK